MSNYNFITLPSIIDHTSELPTDLYCLLSNLNFNTTQYNLVISPFNWLNSFVTPKYYLLDDLIIHPTKVYFGLIGSEKIINFTIWNTFQKKVRIKSISSTDTNVFTSLQINEILLPNAMETKSIRTTAKGKIILKDDYLKIEGELVD